MTPKSSRTSLARKLSVARRIRGTAHTRPRLGGRRGAEGGVRRSRSPPGQLPRGVFGPSLGSTSRLPCRGRRDRRRRCRRAGVPSGDAYTSTLMMRARVRRYDARGRHRTYQTPSSRYEPSNLLRERAVTAPLPPARARPQPSLPARSRQPPAQSRVQTVATLRRRASVQTRR